MIIATTLKSDNIFWGKEKRIESTGILEKIKKDKESNNQSLLTPKGVSASDGIYIDKIRITWNSVKDAEKYYIYRSTSAMGTYSNIEDTTTTQYDDFTASLGGNYYYKVKAWSAGIGYSPYSAYDVGLKWNIVAGVSNREMISVPSGTFTQCDTTVNCFSHTISAFKIGKYEVTYEIWYTVYTWATNNGYAFDNAGKEGHNGTPGAAPTTAKYEPVTDASWRDAIVWCNAYSEMSGYTGIYYSDSGFANLIKDSTDGIYGSSLNLTPGSFDNPYVNWNANGYRLPTQGEWQYAASYKDGISWTPYNYASGATASHTNGPATDLVAWDPSGGFMSHDVGTKNANALGIHDMSGNVWEYCWDACCTWPSTPQTDYKGSSLTSTRIHRGGSFGSPSSDLQVGHRFGIGPYNSPFTVGFRLARTE